MTFLIFAVIWATCVALVCIFVAGADARREFPPAYRAMEARGTYYPPGADPSDQ